MQESQYSLLKYISKLISQAWTVYSLYFLRNVSWNMCYDDVFRYSLFWVLLLLSKLAFSYTFEVSLLPFWSIHKYIFQIIKF